VEITGKQTAALRETVTFKVPKGQYDVRLRRITADADESNRIFDETAWTALRTIRYAYPIRMPGLAMTALRIKATGQLNGVVDRFNGVVSSILPDWNGTEWVAQETANPAALFRHVLQGSANARPLADSRLDLPRIEEWHAANTAAGREFNMTASGALSRTARRQCRSSTSRPATAAILKAAAILPNCRMRCAFGSSTATRAGCRTNGWFMTTAMMPGTRRFLKRWSCPA
jgi:hypothetical protein